MTYAPRANRTDSRFISIAAAALAAVAVSAAIAVAAIGPLGIRLPVALDPVVFSPYVVASAEGWQLQRTQQSLYIDWAGRSATQWEVQRLQQSSGLG